MTTYLSPLARQVSGVRDPKLGKHRDPWGLLFHTTGRGVPEKAKRTGREPIDVAIKTYISSQNGSNGYKWGGPTYVLNYDGTLYQLAPENIFTNHCGGTDRSEYLSGKWIEKAAPAAVAQWHAQWGPRYKHPYQLFPSKSPNNEYVGVEIIPIGSGLGGTPMRAGLLFTKAQHDTAVDLARDIAARHGWPADWHRTPRLLGHEDVQLLNRMDKHGGWDPGWLREKPYFDFDYIRSSI